MNSPKKEPCQIDNKQLAATQEELEKLKQSLEKVGFTLADEGKKVQKEGCPPSIKLLEEAIQVTKKFDRLAKKLQAVSQNLRPIPPSDNLLSTSDLQVALTKLADNVERFGEAETQHQEVPEWTQEKDRSTVESNALLHRAELDRYNETESKQNALGLEELEQIIFRLLKEERLEPAFWLSSYVEQTFGATTVPPLLIKAVELASIVEGNGGPAAEWLTYIFHHCDYLFLFRNADASGKKTGLALLMTASLLRPALIAPESGALDLFRQLCKVEAFLARTPFIEAFWEKKTPDSGRQLQRSLESLADEATIWEKRNQNLSLASPTADQVWQGLREKEGLLVDLIRPVQNNDGKAVETVARLVNCLRQGDNLKKELAILYHKEHGIKDKEIFHIPGSWQVLARLEEAMRMAERWLKVRSKVSHEKEYVKLVEDKTLEEALRSSREALREIIAEQKNEPLVEAAVTLCLQALDKLQGDFFGTNEPRQENLSREELASRELNKDPFLQLHPGSIPNEKTVRRMSIALLELLLEKAENKTHPESGEEEWPKEKTPESLPVQEGSASDYMDEKSLDSANLTSLEKVFFKNVLKDLKTDPPRFDSID